MSVTNARMMMPYEAAWQSPGRGLIFGPPTDPRRSLSGYDLSMIARKARVLESNSAEVRMIVRDMALLCGYLMPRVRSTSSTWNTEARAAFLRRVKSALTFDAAGCLSWQQAQLWLERSAVIDGDALVVALRGEDGGALFAFYEGPQIALVQGEDVVNGVRVDKFGRPVAYALRTGAGSADADVSWIPAAQARLYRHNPRPGQPRGVSELVGAINAAQDLYELYGFHKAAAKLAASFGVVETRQPGGIPDASTFDAMRNGDPVEGDNEPPLTINGVRAVSLPVGHDVKILTDNRPTPEQRQLRMDLTDQLAYACGMDPVAVYHPERMGSAAARYTLQKLNDTIRDRHLDLIPLLNWMMAHVLDCEVASGRLRPCPDMASRRDVEWIPRTNWTIDKGREGQLAIQLVQAGMMDANDWTLSTADKTVVEIVTQRAHDLADGADIATEHGLALSDLLPGPAGSTAPPLGQSAPADGTDDAPPDPSPEPAA